MLPVRDARGLVMVGTGRRFAVEFEAVLGELEAEYIAEH